MPVFARAEAESAGAGAFELPWSVRASTELATLP